MTAESMKRQQAALNQAAKYQTNASIAQGIGSLAPDLANIGSGLFNSMRFSRFA
jgi:hypothetical protein